MPTERERPSSFEDRFRLYIDESGDHVFHKMKSPHHRYLCILGCWIQGASYTTVHRELEAFKQRHIPHNPDEPVILHREDIVNRRKAFWRLRDTGRSADFDEDLLDVLQALDYRIVGVVIDKKALHEDYPNPAHPYHLAIGFLLQRYCGYLNHLSRQGDVMAEGRGGRENRLLMDSFDRVYERGVWKTRSAFFQQALTSGKLKIKQKSANIAGLQIADLLAHPVRKFILRQQGRLKPDEVGPFAQRLYPVIESKLNRHLYDGRVEGYGTVLYPK